MPSMTRDRDALSSGLGEDQRRFGIGRAPVVCTRCGLPPHPGCMSGWLASRQRVRRLDCPHAAVAYVLEEPA
jgi:hypothetical protein